MKNEFNGAGLERSMVRLWMQYPYSANGELLYLNDQHNLEGRRAACAVLEKWGFEFAGDFQKATSRRPTNNWLYREAMLPPGWGCSPEMPPLERALDSSQSRTQIFDASGILRVDIRHYFGQWGDASPAGANFEICPRFKLDDKNGRAFIIDVKTRESFPITAPADQRPFSRMFDSGLFSYAIEAAYDLPLDPTRHQDDVRRAALWNCDLLTAQKAAALGAFMGLHREDWYLHKQNRERTMIERDAGAHAQAPTPVFNL